MTPLSTSAVRARAADVSVNPDLQKGFPLIVPVTLKLTGGLTMTAVQIATALRPVFGRGYPMRGPGKGVFELSYYDQARAESLGQPYTDLCQPIESKMSYAAASGRWVTVGAGVTATRYTTDHAFGPACLRVQTPGTNPNEGVYYLTDPINHIGTMQFGLWVKAGPNGAATNLRLYADERDGANNVQIGRGNGASTAVPGAWGQFAGNVNRVMTGPAGNVLRLGIEVVGTAADDFLIGGISCGESVVGAPAGGGNTPVLDNAYTWDGEGRIMQFLLKFYNQAFDADLLVDALDLSWTVTSDRDELSHNIYEFTLAP